jgi:TPR repeat protein
LISKTGGGSSWSTVAELTAAAQQGNPKACAQLGEMLLRGSDVKQDGPRALVLLEQAARAGVATAAFRLGMLLENGEGVAEDRTRAFAYLRAAAVGGVDEAFRNVGVAYSTGRGVKRDYAEALAWLILAEKHETAGIVGDELRAYLRKIRRAELIPAGERRAPELEQELAQTTVAKTLPPPAPLVFVASAPVKLAAVSASPNSSGDTVAPAEDAPGEPPVKLIAPTGRLLSWPNLAALQRASDQGSTDALVALGQILLEGKLLPEDSVRAAVVLERAAKAGSADAAHHLAELYGKGTRIARDEAKSFTYTLQAARGGVRTDIYNLGALYANGRGTTVNYPEAFAWLLVAQHYNLDSGQVGRIRDYLVKTKPAEVPLAEKRAAQRIREIDAIRE